MNENETFEEAIAGERDQIARAKADAEGLEIECEFTVEEVEYFIDRLEIAHKSDQNPKRNCDRFTDFSTAKHAWHEECFDYDESSGEWVNPKFPNLTFEEWLFATVKEGYEK